MKNYKVLCHTLGQHDRGLVNGTMVRGFKKDEVVTEEAMVEQAIDIAACVANGSIAEVGGDVIGAIGATSPGPKGGSAVPGGNEAIGRAVVESIEARHREELEAESAKNQLAYETGLREAQGKQEELAAANAQALAQIERLRAELAAKAAPVGPVRPEGLGEEWVLNAAGTQWENSKDAKAKAVPV